MTLRSKLLATVAAPMLSTVMIAEPALVFAASGSSEVRVEAEPSGIQVAQATVTCSDGSEAADQSTCDAIDAQKAAQEEARKAAEDEAAKQAEQEAQRQAEEEAQRQAAEQEAARQAEEEAARQAEQEAARQAEEEAARQAEQQAQQQAEEEAARQAAEEEAARQAEQQAAEEAQRQAEQQAAEEAQRQAEEEAAKQAEQEAQQLEAEPQEEQQAEEPAEQSEQPAQQAEEPATGQNDQQEQAEEPTAQPEQPAEQAEQPPVEDELRPAQDAGEAATPGEEPAEQQAGDEQVPGGEQVLVPAVEPPTEQPVPEIVDTRTEEEKQQIAEDPSTTSETVVLPVEGGAAVLDSDKDADNSGDAGVRDARTQQREEVEAAPPPESDADAQAEAPRIEPEVIQKAASEEGTRLDAEPQFEVPTTVVNNVTNVTNVTNNVTNNTNNVVNQVTEVRVLEQVENRTVLNVGNRVVVRHDDRPRLRHDARDTYYEELPRGRVRETIERGDGSRLVTVYNRYGDVIVRSRYTSRGDEYVLFYSPEAEDDRPRMYVDVGESLPPMRLTVPVSDYIVTMSSEPDRDYYDFLARPPVERVERVYSIDEVKSSARLRDKVRRIDLDTITFASGSAEVSLSQAKTLRSVAGAMEQILERDPGEVFLIEGHTDAVGSDQSNLVLSDQRAETVANLLTEVYGIPPENMSTQGYGERYLKIRTQDDEERNRRVTIRRVTPLVKPVAAR
jgi:Outer membrane protein and related peptidoglycan-associated (lipo)proteins